MTDLNELLTDFKDKRLAYKEINRAAHEALMDGIVAEIEALKALAKPPRMTDLSPEVVRAMALAGPGEIIWLDADGRPVAADETLPQPVTDKIVADAVAEHAVAVKRGPGRPPKAEAVNG